MIDLITPATAPIRLSISHKIAEAIAPHLAPGCRFEVPARILGAPVTLAEAHAVAVAVTLPQWRELIALAPSAEEAHAIATRAGKALPNHAASLRGDADAWKVAP